MEREEQNPIGSPSGKPQRVLTGELLDHLPHDDPAARRSRADLVRINFMMGTFPWFRRVLRRLECLEESTHLVEVGAGTGGLALYLRRSCPRLRYTAIDLSPEPPGWPGSDRFRWLQGDALARLAETEGDVLLANLFLHHLTDEQLGRLGEQLSGFKAVVTSEPARMRRFHGLAYAGRALGFNHVTRHDIHASIDAGFVSKELPATMALDEAEWSVEASHSPMGAHRMVATRRSGPVRGSGIL